MSSSEDDAPLMRANGRGKGEFSGDSVVLIHTPLQLVASFRFACSSSSRRFISVILSAIVSCFLKCFQRFTPCFDLHTSNQS